MPPFRKATGATPEAGTAAPGAAPQTPASAAHPHQPAATTSGSTSARFVLAGGAMPLSATPTAAAAAAADASMVRSPPVAGVTSAGEKTASAVADDGSPTRGEKEASERRDSNGAITIEDLQLPKTIIARLARGVLPHGTQIQANAVTALGKSATVFVNYLTTHADANAKAAGKKTILPNDVFKALDEIEFGFMRSTLEEEFAKYSSKNSAKRSNYRQKMAATKKPTTDAASPSTATAGVGAAGASGASADDSAMAIDDDNGGAPRAKRARTTAADSATAEEDDNDTDVDENQDEPEEEEEDDDEDEEDEDDDNDDNDDDEEGGGDGDALEEREKVDEADEALEGNESD